MIHVKSERSNGYTGFETLSERDETPAKSFTWLVQFELGFGGTIVELSDTSVVVVKLCPKKYLTLPTNRV